MNFLKTGSIYKLNYNWWFETSTKVIRHGHDEYLHAPKYLMYLGEVKGRYMHSGVTYLSFLDGASLKKLYIIDENVKSLSYDRLFTLVRS